MKLSKYLYISPPLEGELEGKAFVFSTRSSLSILLSKFALEQLQVCDFSSITDDVMDKLIKYKIVVPNNENEFAHIIEENKIIKEKSDILSFTIQPTANCQFGCYYCGQNHVNHMMDDNVESFCLERIQNILESEPLSRFKKLSITWYGGEPLLGIPVIKRLSKGLLNICERYGLEYRADMVTNGYLLRKSTFLELLINHRIKNYQITLDGVANSHDIRRVLKINRGKTFDAIYRNVKDVVQLDEYKKYGASINVRVNIDKTNYKEVKCLLNKLIEDNISHKVSVTFAPIEDWGGNDAGKLAFTHDEFSKLEMEWLLFCIEKISE